MSNLMRGLYAFIMLRLAERAFREFGEESRYPEIYAASYVGVLVLTVGVGLVLIAHAIAPDVQILATLFSSRTYVVLMGLGVIAGVYGIFVPQKRYRRWAAEFVAKHHAARQRPVLVEALTLVCGLLFLSISAVIAW